MRGHKQLYKCKACGHRFIEGQRRDKARVITEYIEVCFILLFVHMTIIFVFVMIYKVMDAFVFPGNHVHFALPKNVDSKLLITSGSF